MGSKRSKKSKQEGEIYLEKNTKKAKSDLGMDVKIEYDEVDNNDESASEVSKVPKRKSKQEGEIYLDRNMKKGKSNLEMDDKVEYDGVEDNDDEFASEVPKAPKRKKKVDANEVPKKLKKISSGVVENTARKPKPKKKKEDEEGILFNGDVPHINGENHITEDNQLGGGRLTLKEITWPDEDLNELINKIEEHLPKNDTLAFRSRMDKIDWEAVRFKAYSADDCKNTWIQVQKRMRCYRLLSEILVDARQWLNAPKSFRKAKTRKHPDMPRRPLSSYLLFYMKKKDKIVSENPGLEGAEVTKLIGQIYRNLPAEKLEKYEKMAAAHKAEYLEKMRIFYDNHPEIAPSDRLNQQIEMQKASIVKSEEFTEAVKSTDPESPLNLAKSTKNDTEKISKVKPKPAKQIKVDNNNTPKGKRGRKKSTVERPPKKYQTPFGHYFQSEIKNLEAGADKTQFREKCKADYKKMPDDQKVHWINLAEQDLIRYQEETKLYKEKYPEFDPGPLRSILTKEEKLSKERASGKPVKPANSAYALYSRLKLQSEEIKSVHPKDRMNFIANKWKACSEEEKNIYKERSDNLNEKYKKDWQLYLKTLPPEERKILEAKKSRKRKSVVASKIVKPRKTKSTKKQNKDMDKVKFKEPEQPPISAYKYFLQVYDGDGEPAQVWKALNNEDKRKYEDELVKKKQAYIVEFEKFLKSLSKEELEAFSKSRQQIKSEDESSDCSSGSEDEEVPDEEMEEEEHDSENE